MGPTPYPAIVLYSNSKLYDVIRLYGCQDDPQIILSSQRSFTYMYTYKYMYRNMPPIHCTTLDN